MKDFFDTLSDFLSSDLAQNYVWVIVTIFIAGIVTAIFITSLVFDKLIIPLKFREANDIRPQYQRLLEENEKLRKELKGYKNIKGMTEAAKLEDIVMKPDKALDMFLRRR